MRRQIVCSIKIRHRRRHDSVDFVPLLEDSIRLAPIGTVVADRGYDSVQNHVTAEKMGIANAILRPKYENLQVYRTRGYYRKMMKRNFNWDLYHQRSKIETIFYVIKGCLENTSCQVHPDTEQETMYRIAYNCYRITRNSLVILCSFY